MKVYLKRTVAWMALCFMGVTILGNSGNVNTEYVEVQTAVVQNTPANESKHISQTDAVQVQSGEEDDNIVLTKVEYPESYEIENFPILYQMPELPTGCEITAMTMVLNYYGLLAEKVEMATEYLPTLLSAETYVGEGGRMYGDDLNQYFIGDPTTQNGVICGTGAIITAANNFLLDHGSTLRATDQTGTVVEELHHMVSRDIPVMVWCTIGMEDRSPAQGWYTETGTYVDWSRNDHGAVLIGYSPDTVIIADPISGIVEYGREQFESVFASRQLQCVILEEG